MMMPRLEAERELNSINAMTLALGGVKPNDRRRYLARLQRTVRGATPPAKATPEILSAMGVAVRVVPAGRSASSAPRSGQVANRLGDPDE